MDDPRRPSAGPHLPYDELHAALGDEPAARAELDALRARLGDARPDAGAVRRHVAALRGIRQIEARIANWWDDPRTQQWVKSLSDTGI